MERELTIEQKRALALAAARKRMAEAEGQKDPATQPEQDEGRSWWEYTPVGFVAGNVIDTLNAEKQSAVDVNALEQLAAEGGELPSPTADMIKGLSWEDQQRLLDLYKNHPNYKPKDYRYGGWLGPQGDIDGKGVPVALPGVVNNPVGRAIWNAPQHMAEGIQELTSTAGGVIDAGAEALGFDPDLREAAAPDVRMQPGSSMTESLSSEVAKFAAPGAGAAKLTGVATSTIGKIAQFALIEGLIGAGVSNTDQEIGGGRAVLSVLGISPDQIPEDKDDLKFLSAKVGMAMDFVAMSAVTAGLLKGSREAGKIAWSKIPMPLIRQFSESAANRHTAKTFGRDFMRTLDSLPEEKQVKVMSAIQRSFEKSEGSDTFATVFNNLDQIKQSDEFIDVAKEISDVQRHVMNMRNSVESMAGNFEQYSQADARRRGAGLKQMEAFGETPEGGAGFDLDEGTRAIRETGENILEDAKSAREAIPGQRNAVYESTSRIQKDLQRKVSEYYGGVEELVGEEPLSKEFLSLADEAGISFENDTYGEALRSLGKINKGLSRAIQSNDENKIAAFRALREEIYDGELDRIADAVGTDDVKEVLDEAKRFYREEYANTFKNNAPTPSVGPARLAEMDIPEGRSNEASALSQRSAARKSIAGDVADDQDPEITESFRKTFSKYGTDEDLKLLDEMESGKRVADVSDKNAKRYTEDTIGDFVDPDAPRTVQKGRETLPPSANDPQDQFKNMFSSGPNRARNILEQAKKTGEYEKVRGSMKRAWIRHITESIADDPKGTLTSSARPVLLQDSRKLSNTMNSPEWKVAKELFNDDEIAILKHIEDTFQKIDKVDRAGKSSKNRSIPDAYDVITNSNLTMAQKAKNLITTMWLGVLNPTATKARSIGGMVLEATNPSSQQSKYLDSLMSDSRNMTKVMKDLETGLGNKKYSGAVKKAFDQMKGAWIRSGGDEETWDQQVDRIMTDIEQASMEENGRNTTVIEKTIR
jgi:hypothetical protein